jgi:hypothetical protein
MVIALLALFVALGGTGYAAFKLPKNSVGTKQLKKNAVNSSKVKDNSLLAQDFAPGSFRRGRRARRVRRATGDSRARPPALPAVP